MNCVPLIQHRKADVLFAGCFPYAIDYSTVEAAIYRGVVQPNTLFINNYRGILSSTDKDDIQHYLIAAFSLIQKKTMFHSNYCGITDSMYGIDKFSWYLIAAFLLLKTARMFIKVLRLFGFHRHRPYSPKFITGFSFQQTTKIVFHDFCVF